MGHKEFGRNDYRKDAPHFRFPSDQMIDELFQKISIYQHVQSKWPKQSLSDCGGVFTLRDSQIFLTRVLS